ncbi:unnamed protein product, partial [Bubo scandiacus]
AAADAVPAGLTLPAKLGSDTPDRPLLNTLLAGHGVQAPWQAAAPSPQHCLPTASRKKPS